MRGSPWGRLTGTTRRLYGCSCYGDPTGHVIHCHGDRDLSDNDILGQQHSRTTTVSSENSGGDCESCDCGACGDGVGVT